MFFRPKKIDLKDFDKWIMSFDDDEFVGLPGSAICCPVSMFLEFKYNAFVPYTTHNSYSYGYRFPRKLPDEISMFVKRVDSKCGPVSRGKVVKEIWTDVKEIYNV